MRRFFLFFSMILCLAASAAVYSVSELPNVQLRDRTKHLVNPDGIVSPQTNAMIDTLLLDARRQTSAEIVAVIVDDIDSDDINDYATQLFTEWGIGKKDKDNGILILVAKDKREAVIRTGYGAEGIMPDIICGHIIYDTMAPHFKDGDYDTGLLEGVKQVHTIVTDPEVREELMSNLDNDMPASSVYLYATSFVSGGLIILILFTCFTGMYKNNTERFEGTRQMYTILKYTSIFTVGITLLAFLTLWAMRRYWKQKGVKCEKCGAKMQVADEIGDSSHLTMAQNMERRLGSVNYGVWVCPACGNSHIEKQPSSSSKYALCNHCNAMTGKCIANRVVLRPTYHSEGEGERDYECVNCHNHFTKSYIIPMKGSDEAGGGSFGGGGGSFGGGRTGGGGASGRW